jgi:integrase
MPTGTQNTYDTSWQALENFCEFHGINTNTHIPEVVLCDFLVDRCIFRELSSNTIPNILSALKSTYTHRQWPWPGTFMLQDTVKGITNVKASIDIPRQAYPLSYHEISTILQPAYASDTSFRGLVEWAQILLAFFGALRQGDIFSPPIRLQHVTVNEAGHLLINRPQGDKTNREPILIRLLPNKANPLCCPVLATQQVWRLRNTAKFLQLPEDRILFTTAITSKTPSSADWLCKQVEKAIGYKFTSHGFRRGRISHLAAMNVPEMRIRHISRHSTQSTAFSKYVDFASLDFPIEWRDTRGKFKRVLGGRKTTIQIK